MPRLAQQLHAKPNQITRAKQLYHPKQPREQRKHRIDTEQHRARPQRTDASNAEYQRKCLRTRRAHRAIRHRNEVRAGTHDAGCGNDGGGEDGGVVNHRGTFKHRNV